MPKFSVPPKFELSVLVLPVSVLSVASEDFGVPVWCTQSLLPPLLTDRTRTRYSVLFESPVISCDAVVPLRDTATHAVEESAPEAAALSATGLAPDFEADV